MNIKRQYILPNCNLILEGLEDSDPENADILDGQLPMTTLMNAECHFLNSNQKLSGGLIFLENLSHGVSDYAQGFLSGLSHPTSNRQEYPQVTIENIADHLHRLTLVTEVNTAEAKTQVDLTTVELFDLVDAIDQFMSDRTTLPSMTLDLKPVSRRYRQPEQPLVERITPVILGFASLALAAGTLFVIPPPEVRPPESDPVNQTIENNNLPNNNSTQDNTPVPK